VLDEVPCGLLSLDPNGLILWANQTIAAYLTVPVASLTGIQVATILSTPSRVFYETHLYPQLRMRGSVDECYLTLLCPAGDELPVLMNAARSVADGREVTHLAFIPVPLRHELEAQLISARRDAQEALAAKEEVNLMLEATQRELEARQRELTALNILLGTQAVHDELTGLHNRRHFRAALDEVVAQAQQDGSNVSLLLLDLDHFKTVNDQCGHDVGDEVLRRVGVTLLEAVRAGDSVCRYGGEEFAVILPNTSVDQACALGERIRKAVAELDVAGLLVTVSIGVSGSPPLEADPRRLVATADQHLYAAKRAGRNRVERSTEAPEEQS
jgi:sigma-B regulation protein RsbU (phosphoserine phosphatase)